MHTWDTSFIRDTPSSTNGTQAPCFTIACCCIVGLVTMPGPQFEALLTKAAVLLGCLYKTYLACCGVLIILTCHPMSVFEADASETAVGGFLCWVMNAV